MKNKKKKTKLRVDRLLLFLAILFLIIFTIIKILSTRIENIYITNNFYLKDQEIIEIAKISNYPNSISYSSRKIQKNLEKNNLIKEAKVYKKGLTKVYIEITENEPLFYYDETNEIIHVEGTSNMKFSVPTVVNHITDKYFEKFKTELEKLDKDILHRISEIEFVPNEVDDNRFLLYMNDGNLVYINIKTFEKLNKYLTILESLPNKKGILYLDYGNNFEIIS